MNEVSLCITSCGRLDLLESTLNSFFRFNTYPIKNIYIIDDSGFTCGSFKKRLTSLRDKFIKHDIEWLINKKKIGQILSIDILYSKVETPFIFHCEDDWEFYKHGFIEASLCILNQHPKCIQVWLRELNDTNGHPVFFDGIHKMSYNYFNKWHGFSFNPGLRRKSDYRLLGSYSKHVEFNPKYAWLSESIIGGKYKLLGFYAVILPNGYVRHTGEGRHVGPV